MGTTPIAYYDSFADELKSKFQRIKNLVSHRPSSGDYHEEILRIALRNFLSKRYSVKKGFVYKDEKNVSKQVDILIIDEYSASAYIFQDGDFVIVRPEAVVAAIEVKTTLAAGAFDEALKNIASVKGLVESTVGEDQICGIVFGYQGTPPTPKNLHEWFLRPAAQSLKDNQRLGPDAILFFSHETLLIRYNPETKLIGDSDYYHAFVQDEEIRDKPQPDVKSGWQLTILLALIFANCSMREFKKTRMFTGKSEANELINAAGGIISAQAFRLGEGGADYTPDEK